MRLLPFLLLNVVTVAAGIVIYDRLRSDDPAPAVSGGTAVADSALAERVAALEAERRPLLRASAADPRLARRVAELEAKLAALSDGAESAEGSAEAEEPRHAARKPDMGEGPTPEEVARFRKLQAAARKQERAKKSKGYIAATLTKLDIRLSKKQQAQLTDAFAAFQPRRDQIWGEAKRRGVAQGDSVDWPTIIEETNEAVAREFTTRISSFIPEQDAEAISSALNTK